MVNKRRCRLHGGLSTGPKTEAGRAAIAAAHYKHGRYVNWRDKRAKEKYYLGEIKRVKEKYYLSEVKRVMYEARMAGLFTVL